MKQLKRFVLLFILLSGAAQTVNAQIDTLFDRKASTVYADDEGIVKDMGIFVRSHFLDNWFAAVQVGGNLYGGFQDYRGPLFGKNPITDGHLTYSAEIKAGRWVYPALGYRLGLGVGTMHGFLSRQTYNDYLTSIAIHGGQGQAQPGYVGYYWEYDNDLLIQRWKYGCGILDIMVKLISADGYQKNRRFTPILYAGAGFHLAFSEPSDESMRGERQERIGSEIHGGLILNYRFNDNWCAYLDARASILTGTFDREFVAGAELPVLNEDFPIYCQLGVSRHFHFRNETQRTKWDKMDEVIDDQRVERRRQGVFEMITHTYNFATVNYVDTLFSYDTINDFSPEYDSLLLRRARQHVQDQIDSLRRAFDRDCQDAGLDDILGRRLLPYEMVFFELDKWNILKEEDIKIRKMASVMKAFPNYQFLLIGSADSKTGTVKRNDFLSVNRSDVVYNQLVYKYEVNPAQLKRVYMGGILDFDPFELNRATVIIMDHPKVMEEFNKLKAQRQAGGSTVEF